jgi:long-chain acyl-CoA synthetase
LPLSHIFERMAGHFVMWHAGATIAFAESIDTVPQNLVEVRPTVLVSVPRLYEKMNARVLAALEQAPPLRQKLFAWAQTVGRQRVRLEQSGKRPSPWLQLQTALASKLVFGKLRARLGGRMRFMISGGAPLAVDIAEFFFAADLPILEGYGLTETSPVICVNPFGRPRIGTVGPPIDGVEVRIAENGEILARGRNIMQGYYGQPEATANVIEDGWFHTGDVGAMTPDGYLRITDRLKDLIVTSGGKNIAPQPIEARLKSCAYIAEAILIGDKHNYLTALIVPHFAHLDERAKALGIDTAARAQIVAAPEILRVFLDVVNALNVQLPSYERIKRFCLLERELQQEAGEITPSMKVKRNVVAKRYAHQIAAMYAEPPPSFVACPETHVEAAAGQAALTGR